MTMPLHRKATTMTPVRPSAAALLAPLVVLTTLMRWARVTAGPDDDQRDRERGDVPGWVLITLMTAGLVTTIWALAGAQLAELFTQAIASVTGPGKR